MNLQMILKLLQVILMIILNHFVKNAKNILINGHI